MGYTEAQGAPGRCLAVRRESRWHRTHLEGVEHDEDIGPDDAEVDKDPTHPRQPQHGQQHQDGLGCGPVTKKSSKLLEHISKLKCFVLAPHQHPSPSCHKGLGRALYT